MNTMRIFRILGLFILMSGGVAISNKTQAQPGVSISFQTFYNELSPYGRWERNPQFGSVWIPDVPQGFQPYSTNGYWEVTEFGNTWVSDYDWGWAPFHYGRWSFDDYVGWFWVPDYEWGPAWVNWRTGGGYYGWAPLGPGVHVNVSVNIPSFWWVFVPQRYITSPRWRNYCAPPRRVTHVYNQTVIVNNYYRSNNRTYVYGPRRDEIERVTRRSVPVRSIDTSPSGRGRVVVASTARGNDRYNSRDNSRNSRVDPSRRGSVIDASPDNRRERNDDVYNRNERNNGSRPSIDPRSNDRFGGNPRTPVESRGNDRSNREAAPTENRDNRFERPSEGRSSRNEGPAVERNNRMESPRQPERSRMESPRQPERSRMESAPAPERSSRSRESASPSQNRGSYEAPQRSSGGRAERSSEQRGNSQGASRGASERGSRSPR